MIKKGLRILITLFGGLILGYFVYQNFSVIPSKNVPNILSALASHSITLSSILVATLAILLSISGSRLVKRMAETGHFKNLLRSILNCIAIFMIVFTASMIILYLPAIYLQMGLAITSGIMLIGLIIFIRTCWKFYLVLFYLHS